MYNRYYSLLSIVNSKANNINSIDFIDDFIKNEIYFFTFTNQKLYTLQYIIFKNPSNMHCIALNAKTVKQLTTNNNKRALCIINKTVELHCAILRTKEDEYYVIISKAICKQLQLQAGSKIDCEFSIDEAEHQFEMPETLQEVLHSDDDAKKIFDSLTDGNKRSLMHLATLVKNTDKQIERALLIAEKLKLGITQARLVLKK